GQRLAVRSESTTLPVSGGVTGLVEVAVGQLHVVLQVLGGHLLVEELRLRPWSGLPGPSLLLEGGVDDLLAVDRVRQSDAKVLVLEGLSEDRILVRQVELDQRVVHRS